MTSKYTITIVIINLIVAGLLGYNLMAVVGLDTYPTTAIVLVYAVCTLYISVTSWVEVVKARDIVERIVVT